MTKYIQGTKTYDWQCIFLCLNTEILNAQIVCSYLHLLIFSISFTKDQHMEIILVTNLMLLFIHSCLLHSVHSILPAVFPHKETTPRKGMYLKIHWINMLQLARQSFSLSNTNLTHRIHVDLIILYSIVH